MMEGSFNQLLRINLSKQESAVEPIPESILRTYLGGKGLGSYLLLKENPPDIDPFSPQNRLIFTLGPLADSPFYGSSRYAIFTGGKSQNPIFLEISDKDVTFHSASKLGGKETYGAEEAILKKVDKNSGTLVIGPAGENLVKFAVIESEQWRSLGRAGMGSVMGSKRLRGIAFHGRKRRELAAPSSLKGLSQEFKE